MFLRLFENFVKFPFYSLSLRQGFPLGGKVDKAKLWTNEGRNLFSIRIISIKGCNLLALPSLSPSGKVARSADRGLFKISPYVAASPCLFLLSQKSAKIVSLVPRLPLGGRLRREAVVRGATCFLSELFQSRVATCSSAPRFPLWEPLSNCRFKAISASKVAAKPPIEVSPL